MARLFQSNLSRTVFPAKFKTPSNIHRGDDSFTTPNVSFGILNVENRIPNAAFAILNAAFATLNAAYRKFSVAYRPQNAF